MLRKQLAQMDQPVEGARKWLGWVALVVPLGLLWFFLGRK